VQPKYLQLLLELNLCLHPTHGGTPNYHFAPPATAGYDGRSNPDYYPALSGFSPYSPANSSRVQPDRGLERHDVLTPTARAAAEPREAPLPVATPHAAEMRLIPAPETSASAWLATPKGTRHHRARKPARVGAGGRRRPLPLHTNSIGRAAPYRTNLRFLKYAGASRS